MLTLTRLFRHLVLATLLATSALSLAVGQESGPALAPGAAAADYVPTVLITGANRGIGLEYVNQYGARGWNVIATARRPAEAAELRALAAANPRISIETLDVSDLAAIDALAEKLRGRPVDILVNNAGITGGAGEQMLGKFNWDVYEQIFRVNVIGPLKMAEAFLPHLEAGRQKKLVNVSSSQGSIASADGPRLTFYRASKAALNMEMVVLSHALKNKGIAVALINPGPVDTDMMAGMPKSMLRSKEDAVADLIRITDRLNLNNSGTFWNWSGELLPW